MLTLGIGANVAVALLSDRMAHRNNAPLTIKGVLDRHSGPVMAGLAVTIVALALAMHGVLTPLDDAPGRYVMQT